MQALNLAQLPTTHFGHLQPTHSCGLSPHRFQRTHSCRRRSPLWSSMHGWEVMRVPVAGARHLLHHPLPTSPPRRDVLLTLPIGVSHHCYRILLRSCRHQHSSWRRPTLLLGILPRDNHRDDDITIVSITYIMSLMNIHYRQTCID